MFKIHLKNKFFSKIFSIGSNFFRFGIISVVIFLLIFTILYGGVYFEVFSWRIEKIFGLKSDTVFSAYDKINVTNNDLLEINKSNPIKNIDLADLNLFLTPPDNRVIISKVNKNLPIVSIPSENLIKENIDLFEKDMMKGLESGIVHYPLTSDPGEPGNVVLTGHSSYYSWAEGNFKDSFAIMHNIEIGDKITIYYNQQKYIYQIFEKKITNPDDLSALYQPKDEYFLTTITCTPIGTNQKRLIHVAKQIYPSI